MSTNYSPSMPAAARRDFMYWSNRIQDDDADAQFARDCADVLARQGVELPDEMPVKRRVSSSGYRGVEVERRYSTCRWTARIELLSGPTKWRTMTFRTPEAAARQYDAWSWETYHDKRRLNFPDEVK